MKKSRFHFGCVQARVAGKAGQVPSLHMGRETRAHPVPPFPRRCLDGGAWAHPEWSLHSVVKERSVCRRCGAPGPGGRKTKRPGSLRNPGLGEEVGGRCCYTAPAPGHEVASWLPQPSTAWLRPTDGVQVMAMTNAGFTMFAGCAGCGWGQTVNSVYANVKGACRRVLHLADSGSISRRAPPVWCVAIPSRYHGPLNLGRSWPWP